MARPLRLSWLDVFTDRPLAGNPLAVVPDADALDAAAMQAVAAELGLSETVFVLGGARRLRIFTPRSELPLAGHPVVGAAVELARLGPIPAPKATASRGSIVSSRVRIAQAPDTIRIAIPGT